jgi:hypothetical protein
MEGQTELLLLGHRLSSMETHLEGLTSDIHEIDQKTTQLIDALIGNKIAGNDGLTVQVKAISKKVEEHDEILKRFKWFWLGVVALGSLLAAIIQLFIKTFGS